MEQGFEFSPWFFWKFIFQKEGTASLFLRFKVVNSTVFLPKFHGNSSSRSEDAKILLMKFDVLTKLLFTHMVTNYLFVKIILLSLPCIHYKLMKLNFAMFLVLFLSSWWQQTLGKTYGLRCQNGVLVSDSFAFTKTKSCKQHALLVQ